MCKFVHDGQRRYREAQAQTLDDKFEARSARIRRHYRSRLTGAPLWRNLLLRFMQQRHLARVRREVYGENNLYVSQLRMTSGR